MIEETLVLKDFPTVSTKSLMCTLPYIKTHMNNHFIDQNIMDQFCFQSAQGPAYINFFPDGLIEIIINNEKAKSFKFVGLQLTKNISSYAMRKYLSNSYAIIKRDNYNDLHITFYPKTCGGGSLCSSCKKQEALDKEEIVEYEELLIDKRKSTGVTSYFETNWNDFLSNYKKNRSKQMKDALGKLLQTDLYEVYDVERYFDDLFSEVFGRKTSFMKIDLDQRLGIKEDILHLLHNLALVYFYSYKKYGIKIESKEAEEKISTLKRFLEWAKSSESKLSFSEVIYSLELVINLLEAMPESQNFLDKLGLQSQVKGILWNIVTLNLIKGGGDLVQTLSKAAVLVIAENIRQDLENNPTIAILHIQALSRSVVVNEVQDDKMLSSFLDVVEDAISAQYVRSPDWKVYYKLAWAMGEITRATTDPLIQEKILFEGSSRKHASLEGFVKFGKFWLPGNNGWRIRERALQEFIEVFEKTPHEDIKNQIHAILIASTIQNDEKIRYKIKMKLKDISKTCAEVKNKAATLISLQTDELTSYLQTSTAKDNHNKMDDELIAKEREIEAELCTIQQNCQDSELDTVKELIYEIAGKRAYASGKYKDAIKHYIKDVQTKKNKYGDNSLEVGLAYKRLGRSYLAEEDYEQALEWQQKALAIAVTKLGAYHHEVAMIHNDIGDVYFKKQEFSEAIKYYQKAFDIKVKKHGLNHKSVGFINVNIARAYEEQGNYEEAISYYQKAFEIFVKRFGPDHAKVGSVFASIGSLYFKKNEYEQAINYFNKGIKTYKKLHGETHPDLANLHEDLAKALEKAGRLEDALVEYSNAFDIYLVNFGNDYPDTISVQEQIVELRNKLATPQS